MLFQAHSPPLAHTACQKGYDVSANILQSICGFLPYIILVYMLNVVAAKININLGYNFRMRQLRETVSSNKLHSGRVRVRKG